MDKLQLIIQVEMAEVYPSVTSKTPTDMNTNAWINSSLSINLDVETGQVYLLNHFLFTQTTTLGKLIIGFRLKLKKEKKRNNKKKKKKKHLDSFPIYVPVTPPKQIHVTTQKNPFHTFPPQISASQTPS